MLRCEKEPVRERYVYSMKLYISEVRGETHMWPADMWALGCLLAELTLGRPLFDTTSEEASRKRFLLLR